MKIQRTTVTEVRGKKVQVMLQISDDAEIEDSHPHLLCSVVVSTEQDEMMQAMGTQVSFQQLQIRALREAVALLDQVEAAIKDQP